MAIDLDFFKDKKVTLMGLGLLGRGVGDARFLAECGAQLTVTDLKSEADLSDSVEALRNYPDIRFVLGRHDKADFERSDMVIKAAGVPIDNEYVNAAKASGVPVYMSTALLAAYARDKGARIVGVTGTRGKSTVTQMIYEAIKVEGVHIGGNVRGMSTLALMPEIRKGDTVVLELDSWQLQGFRDLAISPEIAVFTNFMPDHMNYYNNDLEAYFHDKAAIFENQQETNILICGKEIAEKIRQSHPPVRIIIPEALPPEINLSVPGDHNRRNAALAFAALKQMGEDEDKIADALSLYSGLEGRLEFLAEIRGVKIYNDSNATTPAASMAAVKAFDSGRVLLIAGGADKGLDIEEWAGVIEQHTKCFVLLNGTGTQRLLHILPGSKIFDSLEEAVKALFNKAESGDMLLLSPGFASFGMFRNEYDRGDRFKAIVRDLQ